MGCRRFAKMYGTELRQFLMDAQIHGYGAAEPCATEDGGMIIEYQEGIWRSKDVWYGGEPFSGMLTVFREDVACFNMVYWGKIFPFVRDRQPVLDCLFSALQRPNLERPWRGPRKYRTPNGLRYANVSTGSVREFSGRETIMSAKTNGDKLYEANYIGGLVNIL